MCDDDNDNNNPIPRKAIDLMLKTLSTYGEAIHEHTYSYDEDEMIEDGYAMAELIGSEAYCYWDDLGGYHYKGYCHSHKHSSSIITTNTHGFCDCGKMIKINRKKKEMEA